MCTALTVNANDNYFGRNLDYEYSFGEKICITPRKYPFYFSNGDFLSDHYAIIGMALITDNYPLYFDATNEHGLSMAGLNFPGNAVYNQCSNDKINIASYELIPYILSQYKTLSQLMEFIDSINIINKPFKNELPPTPLHWLIADKEKCICLEQTKEGLNVYDNPCGVLTNNPEFHMQLFNLNNYLSLSSKEPENRFSKDINLNTYSKGMGALGLPGDFSSASRFIKACFVKLNMIFGETESDRINDFFHVLSSVCQYRGCVKTADGNEYTQYSSCCNADRGIYYYTSYNNQNINAVDMHRENLNSSFLIAHELIKTINITMQN
ncbi:MAG: choloylglycine hydrolase [Clostridia bacterium]|nr:choloylglycine hydrolase [Clostridia bacterium]